MLVSIISLIISLLLQGGISNFLGYTISDLSIFSAVYVLINLIVIQQYFEDSKKNLIIIIVFGLLMDQVYTNTSILCACIFVLIFYFNKFLNFFLPYNLFTVNVFSLLSMIVYHLVSFFVLVILRFDSYGILILFKVIGCNIIMTIIYTSILYLVINYIYKRFDLKVIRDK